MNNLLGIMGIALKAIECDKNDMTEVNEFLDEYDGYIIDIQIIPLMYGKERVMITYKATEEDWIESRRY